MARSTIWMARSTPAQKPRGLASRIVSGFFDSIMRKRSCSMQPARLRASGPLPRLPRTTDGRGTVTKPPHRGKQHDRAGCRGQGAHQGGAGDGQGLLVVRLRNEQEPAILRRQPQGRRLHADEAHRREIGRPLALRLQALKQKAAMRRHAQDPRMIAGKLVSLAPIVLALTLAGCGGKSGKEAAAAAYCPTPLAVQDAQRLTRFKA